MGFDEGAWRLRDTYLHPDNRNIVASLIGAAVIDDPREFGNWCKHGFELLEQFRLGERDERVMFARANAALQNQPAVTMGGDRIPLAAGDGREPSPEALARWNARVNQHLQAGHAVPTDQPQFVPQTYAGAAVSEAALAQSYGQPVAQPGDMAAVVQDLVRRELASLQGSAYAATGMPQQAPAPTPFPAAPVVRPTPTWTNGGFTPSGYVVPARR